MIILLILKGRFFPQVKVEGSLSGASGMKPAP